MLNMMERTKELLFSEIQFFNVRNDFCNVDKHVMF